MKNTGTGTTIMVALAGVAVLLAGYSLYKAGRPQVGVINFAVVQQKAKAYVNAAEQQKKYDEQVRFCQQHLFEPMI